MNMRQISSPVAAPSAAILLLGATILMGSPMAAFATGSNIEQLRTRFGSDLVLVAPLSNLNRTLHTAVAMGQNIQLTAAGEDACAALAPHQLVAITGKVTPDGLINADSVTALSETVVDGSTEILVTGKVTRVNSEAGSASMSNLKVTYTPAMYSTSVRISQGEKIQLVGVHYSMNNLFVADQVIHASQRLGPFEESHSTDLVSDPVSLVSKGGSMGSGRMLGGSMGSGTSTTLAGGSMGSGSPAAVAKGGSMGSGRMLGGSMGSGASTTLAGGSMGSGSPAVVDKGGSMGSGRSLGGSMGSGAVTTLTGGSMGSGSPAAVAKGGSMGSGRSLGGSMGSGAVTTLTGGSMGSGSPALAGGSMGSGAKSSP